MFKGHGGNWQKLLSDQNGLDSGKYLDFSSNVSPLGPPPALWQILKTRLDSLKHLPEVEAFPLKQAISEYFSLSPEHVLVGAGTSDFIYILPWAFSPRAIYINYPTYSDYEQAANISGIDIKSFQELTDRLADSSGNTLTSNVLFNDMVFLCNPNNPTGEFIPPEDLLYLINRSQDILWIVDESYAPFVGPDSQTSLLSCEMPCNLLVLRSFSKIYGVPGLRLGALLGHPSNIDRVEMFLRPWAVGTLSIEAGVELLTHDFYVETVRKFCIAQRDVLVEALSQHPYLQPKPADTHFFLVDVLAPWTSRMLFERLLRHGVLIRECSNFKGLKDNVIRISPGTKEANLRLIELLFSFCSDTP